MALIINNEFAWLTLNNTVLTDETNSISGRWGYSNRNGVEFPSKVAIGMSFYGPDHLEDYDMVVPFQEIDFLIPTPENPDGWTPNFTLNISSYQNDIRSFMSGFSTGTIYAYVKLTNSDNEYVGWQLCSMTIVNDTQPEFDGTPTVVVTDTLSKNLTGNSSTVIKYVSDVNVSFEAHTKKGSYFTLYIVRGGSKSVSSTSILTDTQISITQPMSDVDAKDFTVTLEDSRGFRTPATGSAANLIDYFYPTCHIEVENLNSTGGATNIAINGKMFVGSFGSSNNTATVQYRYRKDGGSYTSWTTASTTLYQDDQSYTASASVYGLDYRAQYEFEARITDAITTVSSSSGVLVGTPVFDWSKSDFNFNVPVAIQGTAQINGTTQIDGDLVVTGTVSGSNISNDTYSAGTWTPRTSCCPSPDVAYGNYMRIGDVCVVNFFFSGTITATPSGDKFYFTGLPFTPDSTMRWQAGGGNCMGYAMIVRTSTSPSGDVDRDSYRFTGWSIESGYLYGRATDMIGAGGSTYKETVSGGYTRSYQTIDNNYYITVAPGAEFYASGTICYKVA